MNVETFRQGTRIVKQGAVGDRVRSTTHVAQLESHGGHPSCQFYIIRDGSVRVTQDRPGSAEQAILVDLKEGDYFGELALMNDEPRKVAHTASSPLPLCTRDRAAHTWYPVLLAGACDCAYRRGLLLAREGAVQPDPWLADRRVGVAEPHSLAQRVGARRKVPRSGPSDSPVPTPAWTSSASCPNASSRRSQTT